MTKKLSILGSAAMALAIVATSFVSTQSAPMPIPTPRAVETGGYIPAQKVTEIRYIRRGHYVYYNGHRGYAGRRSGYRLYRGLWFPVAAFVVAPAVIVAIPGTMSVRVRDCHNRYRSYRASDNSYQPTYGPRRFCK